MAERKKLYPYHPMILYNLANDIVEMYKAKVTRDDDEQFSFVTRMYGQKACYLFRFEKQPEGCLLSIGTDGDGGSAERRVSFMFSIADNMLASFIEPLPLQDKLCDIR
jgi:hypothetical protein